MADGESEKYDKEELRTYLFEIDNLLHTRVNIFVLVETIFLVGAVAVIKDSVLVAIFSAVGIFTTIMLTLINLKLYWRITWLVFQAKAHSEFYGDYLKMKMKDEDKGKLKLGPVARYIQEKFMHEEQPRWFDSGFLMTWVLGIILIVSWLAVFLSSLWNKGTPACP